MTMNQMLSFGIVVVFTVISFVLGIRQLLHKGDLINNAYVYKPDAATQRKYIDRYYRQSGIVFMFITLVFVFVTLYTYTADNLFRIIEFILVAVTIVFAVVSSKAILDKIKKEEREE